MSERDPTHRLGDAMILYCILASLAALMFTLAANYFAALYPLDEYPLARPAIVSILLLTCLLTFLLAVSRRTHPRAAGPASSAPSTPLDANTHEHGICETSDDPIVANSIEAHNYRDKGAMALMSLREPGELLMDDNQPIYVRLTDLNRVATSDLIQYSSLLDGHVEELREALARRLPIPDIIARTARTDPSARVRAVAVANPNVQGDELFLRIALEDNARVVGLAAVTRIISPETLAVVADRARKPQVRQRALERLPHDRQDLLEHLAKNAHYTEQAQQAVLALASSERPTSTLADVAIHSQWPKAAEAAIERVTNETHLLKIASATDARRSLMAVKRMTTRTALSEVAETHAVASIRDAAKKRLQDDGAHSTHPLDSTLLANEATLADPRLYLAIERSSQVSNFHPNAIRDRAWRDESHVVRTAAIAQIHDQQELMRLACDNTNPQARIAALTALRPSSEGYDALLLNLATDDENRAVQKVAVGLMRNIDDLLEVLDRSVELEPRLAAIAKLGTSIKVSADDIARVASYLEQLEHHSWPSLRREAGRRRRSLLGEPEEEVSAATPEKAEHAPTGAGSDSLCAQPSFELETQAQDVAQPLATAARHNISRPQAYAQRDTVEIRLSKLYEQVNLDDWDAPARDAWRRARSSDDSRELANLAIHDPRWEVRSVAVWRISTRNELRRVAAAAPLRTAEIARSRLSD